MFTIQICKHPPTSKHDSSQELQTKSASLQLDSHRDVLVPSLGVEANVPGHQGVGQSVLVGKVVVVVTAEHLRDGGACLGVWSRGKGAWSEHSSGELNHYYRGTMVLTSWIHYYILK